MARTIIAFGAFANAVLFGQSADLPSTAAKFVVASVKSIKPELRTWSGTKYDGVFVTYCQTLKNYIQVAYHTRESGIAGPDWLASEWYEVVAKLPNGQSRPTPEMLQSLLVERFGLAIHHAKEQRPVYFLSQEKGGAKLRPTGKDSFAHAIIRKGAAGYHMEVTARTLEVLTTALSAFVDRPVIDTTGIKGRYDFSLDFSFEEGDRRVATAKLNGMFAAQSPAGSASAQEVPPAAESVSIFQSIRAYGLKLQPEKAPVDILIVDHISRTPTEN